jgi:hypothetical protein
VVAATTPTIAFSPDGVAAAARSRLRRRRAATALGGAASAAAVAIAVADAQPGSTQPAVTIQLDVDSAKAIDQLGAYGNLIQDGTAVDWQHKDSQKLADGSTVTWIWSDLRVGTEMAVHRVYPDGRQITIQVNDVSSLPGQKAGPYKPFPFTTAALIAAVSDPTLKLPVFPQYAEVRCPGVGDRTPGEIRSGGLAIAGRRGGRYSR